jgi:hypothetical protein
VIDFSSSDQFIFDAPASAGYGFHGAAQSDAADVDIGVNFASDLASASAQADDGWFLYHTGTGVLEWEAGVHSEGHDGTVIATLPSHFLLSSGDGWF